MTELEPTGQVAGLTARNLAALVQDMGVEPGWRAAADLYRWYVGMCRERDLEPPSARSFGVALKALGYRAAIRRDPSQDGKHARCWFLTRRAWRGELPPRE